MSLHGEAALSGGELVVPNRGAGLIQARNLANHILQPRDLEPLLDMPIDEYWQRFDIVCPLGEKTEIETAKRPIKFAHALDKRYGKNDDVRSITLDRKAFALIVMPEGLLVGESHTNMSLWEDDLEPTDVTILDRGDIRLFSHIPGWGHYTERQTALAALFGLLVQ